MGQQFGENRGNRSVAAVDGNDVNLAGREVVERLRHPLQAFDRPMQQPGTAGTGRRQIGKGVTVAETEGVADESDPQSGHGTC